MKNYWFFILVLIIAGCSSDPEGSIEEIFSSSEYFPLEEGATSSYKITEVIYRGAGSIRDTLTSFYQERVNGTTQDGVGNLLFIIDRYTRPNAEANWEYINSWFAQIVENQVIRIEENKKFIKLKLPEVPDAQWDGNALFDDTATLEIGNEEIDYFKNWNSKMTSFGQSGRVNEISFQDVHTITLADHENRLEIRSGIEQYARGYGLIYKKLMILDTQCFDQCANIPWEEKAERGHIFIQEIL